MKIYHTETQADYDALMVELERQGCTWATGDKMTELTKNWKRNSSETCVRVDKKVVMYDEKGYFTWKYPEVPIQKYKAKAEEKMKFTKENVEKVIDEYFQEADFEPCGDLIAGVYNLDDTPEKVVVPKFVAEWIESEKGYNIWRMIEDLRNGNSLEKSVINWLEEKYPKYGLRDSFDLLALMRIKGYTIEPEQLYYIPLPDLETSDGIQQVLSKRENGTNYFASRPNESLKQRYTKEELERVPEIYKPFAKPLTSVGETE